MLSPNQAKTSGNSLKKKKAMFQDFSRRAPDGFELISQYYYNKGKIEITHSNVIILNQAANYMESCSLIEKTEKFLRAIDSWTWSELLLALKQGHEQLALLSSYNNNADSVIIILQRFVDELVTRLVSSNLASASSSSCTSFRSSCDSRSTATDQQSTSKSYSSSFKNSCHWWFEDLASMLDIEVIDMVVRTMLAHKFDHLILSKFLLYYPKFRFRAFCASRGDQEQCTHSTSSSSSTSIERVIDLLLLLDRRSISLRGLFDFLRLLSHSKLIVSKSSKKSIELLIGAQLDEATLDDLLIPPPKGKNYVYNVNLVLRLIRNFLAQAMTCRSVYSTRLRKVARLMDFYVAEVAPDIGLKPSKFSSLLSALPDFAHECHHRLYYAMDIYFEIHQRICEDQKMRICSRLNISKLPLEVLNQLSRNTNFPVVVTVKALVYRNYKVSNYGSKGLKMFRRLGLVKEYGGATEMLSRNRMVKSRPRQQIGSTPYSLDGAYYADDLSSSKICCPENVKYLPKLCSW